MGAAKPKKDTQQLLEEMVAKNQQMAFGFTSSDDPNDPPIETSRISAYFNPDYAGEIANGFVSAMQEVSPNSSAVELAKSMVPSAFKSIAKAGGGTYYGASAPPSMQTFGRISYAPQQDFDISVLQWPGIPPDALTKISRDHLAPQMIIRNRVDDVIRYSQISSHPWKAGWQITPKDHFEKVDDDLRKEIREAEAFLIHGGTIFESPIDRDACYFSDFPHFLAQIVDSSLIYDGIAVYTNRNNKQEILSFAPFPTQNIRLVARTTPNQQTSTKQYGSANVGINFFGSSSEAHKENQKFKDGDPRKPFCVGVDETGNAIYTFNREQMIWYTRNPRTDGGVQNYGYSEIEIALLLIKGFTDAIRFNVDIFDKNSIPKGILVLKGQFTAKTFDAMSRAWSNLQRGPRTDWTLPVIQLTEKGEISIVSLEPLRGNEGFYHHLVNLFFGVFAAVYRFPIHRLGYKASGTNSDPKRDWPRNYLGEEDIGLTALLTHLENLVNAYLIEANWPHLQFLFTGKSPKEEGRLYEARMLSMCADEKRLEVGLPKYTDIAVTEAAKVVASIMGLAPVDPALTGVFSTIVQAIARIGVDGLKAMIEGEQSERLRSPVGEQIPATGSSFSSKKDPAKSEKHGHASGIRRDSRREKGKGVPGTGLGVKPNASIEPMGSTTRTGNNQ